MFMILKSNMPKKIEDVYTREIFEEESKGPSDGGLLSKLRDFADIKHRILHESVDDKLVLGPQEIDEISEANLLVMHGRLRVHKGKNYVQINFVYPSTGDISYIPDIREIIKECGFRVYKEQKL